MNKQFGMLTAAALMLGMTACSSEEPIPGGTATGNDEGLYATIELRLPTATRSQTTDWDGNTNSTDGYEIGKDYENNINNVCIVLAQKDANGKYQAKAVGETNVEPVQNADGPKFTMLFKEDELLDLAGETVYVFAYCNTNLARENFLITEGQYVEDFEDYTYTLTEGMIGINQGIWKQNNFMMANAANMTYNDVLADANTGEDETTAVTGNVHQVRIPSKERLLSVYNSSDNPFPLGEVSVTRVCARFDFRQVNNNIYPIYKMGFDKVEENRVADIEVLEMAPINIAKEFYFLPRVSADGQNSNFTLSGIETNKNWVVSPYADLKKNKLVEGAEIFNNYFYANDEFIGRDFASADLVYTKLSSLTEDDNDPNWDGASAGTVKDDYKIWRYVTENTIPEIESQQAGITTGIVFKAEIKNPAQGTPLAEAMAKGASIYEFRNVIYGDATTMRNTAMAQGEDSPLYKAVASVFGEGVFMADEEGNLPAVKDAVSGQQQFKIYRNSGTKEAPRYYTYYVYYNRHNDNNDSGNMGTMEFGTVRNNIYKIYINTIAQFGHTEKPGDDDDPEKPDDPDEDPKSYFSVVCRVLPWMVRVNGIDF